MALSSQRFSSFRNGNLLRTSVFQEWWSPAIALRIVSALQVLVKTISANRDILTIA